MERTYQAEACTMILLDANYILRYLLSDDEMMFEQAKETIDNNSCMVIGMVLAEVVYVLEGVYQVTRGEVQAVLTQFLMQGNIVTSLPKEQFITALEYYYDSKIDFVDGCLCALQGQYSVKTFDKRLQKCLKK